MTKVDINDVLCLECRFPATLNEQGYCEFCIARKPQPRYADRSEFPWLGFAVIAIVGSALIVIMHFLFPPMR